MLDVLLLSSFFWNFICSFTSCIPLQKHLLPYFLFCTTVISSKQQNLNKQRLNAYRIDLTESIQACKPCNWNKTSKKSAIQTALPLISLCSLWKLHQPIFTRPVLVCLVHFFKTCWRTSNWHLDNIHWQLYNVFLSYVSYVFMSTIMHVSRFGMSHIFWIEVVTLFTKFNLISVITDDSA